MPEFVVDLFVDKDEAEHGSAQAPLVVALLKQHQLKQGGQQLGQQLWPLLHVGSNCLRRPKRVVSAADREQQQGKAWKTWALSTVLHHTPSMLGQATLICVVLGTCWSKCTPPRKQPASRRLHCTDPLERRGMHASEHSHLASSAGRLIRRSLHRPEIVPHKIVHSSRALQGWQVTGMSTAVR